MRIGKLASESGFSRDTIRYYEKLGLLQVGRINRMENGYKDYSPKALAQLIQIKELKALGFTLHEIRSLSDALSDDQQPCANLADDIDKKIAQLDNKMAAIELYRHKLVAVRDACDGECETSITLPDCFAYCR